MKSTILMLIMALCGEDKECLTQSVLLEPKTAKQAVLDVRAAKAMRERLTRGYNDCGPYPGCFQGFIKDDHAAFLFKCMRRPAGELAKCNMSFFDSPEYKRLKKAYDFANPVKK